MENPPPPPPPPKKKKKNFFFGQIGIFCLELGKNILFGIGNGAEFWPQNRVIESPVLKQNISVVGTQKNRLNQMILLSTQIMFKVMVKKIFTI